MVGPAQQTALIASLSVVFGLLLLIIVGCTAYFVAKKRLNPGVPEGVLIASINPEYLDSSCLYRADEWEVPRDKITLIRELGKGSFGMVYEGIARDVVEGIPEVKVAVKVGLLLLDVHLRHLMHGVSYSDGK